MHPTTSHPRDAAFTHQRTLLVVVLAAVAVLTGVVYSVMGSRGDAGADATDAPPTSSTAAEEAAPDHVLVVGDSVTLLSREEIEAGLDGVDLTFVTGEGMTSSDLLPLTRTAQRQRRQDGDRLDRAVFLVGYNDVMWPTERPTDLDELVALSARHECAIWLTLPARPSGAPPASPWFRADRAEEFNVRLAEIVEAHDGLHLVRDWEEEVNASTDGELLTLDDIHPNQDGQRELAQVMRQALDRSCQPRG